MSTYTPGSWSSVPCSHGGRLLLRGGPETRHPQPSLQIVPGEDAVLMAAAPDMLAALRAIVGDDWGAHPVDIARAAIAKATGVQP